MSFSFQSISSEPLKLSTAVENTDATIVNKMTARNVHRAALGDIGNKVSKMTIDSSKQVVKKEIVRPLTRLQKTKMKLSAWTAEKVSLL